MNTIKLNRNYGIYGLTLDIAEVAVDADVKPLRKAEKALARAIADEHVADRRAFSLEAGYDFTPPTEMKVRVTDIHSSGFLDCLMTAEERNHVSRGALLSFPNDEDEIWRTWSWYKKKWNGDWRIHFDITIEKLEKQVVDEDGLPLTLEQERVLHAGRHYRNEVQNLIDVLTAREIETREERRIAAETAKDKTAHKERIAYMRSYIIRYKTKRLAIECSGADGNICKDKMQSAVAKHVKIKDRWNRTKHHVVIRTYGELIRDKYAADLKELRKPRIVVDNAAPTNGTTSVDFRNWMMESAG